ncbi:MAG: recombination protein O N-terminal domain-containing protein [Bacteroidales bacterium]|jgi:DNA repair protein RecO (recombination protein O)|nr:recombination protein O N-terminal domain-containing protein [Bacteroidales bacterium]MBQ1938442.1 recombination protein O N-terminal domain-containing protein [Bacteroidales bacterium]
MKQRCEFIVLHSTAYAENALVIHTFSQEYGKRSFLVRGIGKKVSQAYFQPLNIVEAEIIESQKSSLWLAHHFHQEHPLNAIRESMNKNCISLFLSEVLLKTLQEEEIDAALYQWLRGRILLLDALEQGVSNFHLGLLKELCERIGYHPSQEQLLPFEDEGAFEGGPLKENFEEILLMRLNGEKRCKIVRTYLKFLEYHLDTPLHIRSLDVLGCMF